MTGREYLENIREELSQGRYQHRMGENVLRAFGYVRRRATAIEEINATLDELGLMAVPPISANMPLRAPRIRFRLKPENHGVAFEEVSDPEPVVLDEFDSPSQDSEIQDIEDSTLPEPAFSISELTSANADVECISSSASIQEAYTTMLLRKFSQLVVADSAKPMQQDIKGIISFHSMTTAMMNGNPTTVGECIDKDVIVVQSDADLKVVVSQLSPKDVVLVIGRDKRLQGIVTAWDLAEEFAQLVDPFKRIGEIEERLRTLLRKRLGKDKVVEFLTDHGLSSDGSIAEIDELTMGELLRVLEAPQNWDALNIPLARGVFIKDLDKARSYRNRLMHFRDPLDESEMTLLSNFCDTVRLIQL